MTVLTVLVQAALVTVLAAVLYLLADLAIAVAQDRRADRAYRAELDAHAARMDALRRATEEGDR